MKLKVVLTTLLGVAVFAVPAAVPASQPANVRLNEMAAPVAVTPAPTEFAMLLADPRQDTALSIELPAGYTTLEWINQSPFAL